MQNGSFKLFRAFGIDVFLHWSWFVMAVFIVPRMDYFDSTLWSLLLLVSLFAIVTMHEFGHALACRSVGGQTRNIVLWPLGGIAYVNPPARPGAVLWSIVAGPLVNVALVPLTVLAFPLVGGDFAAVLDAMADGALIPAGTDLQRYCFVLMVMNFGLLVFNMIPVYPLDGGQVLMSLLWFVVGRAKALKIASVLGLAAAVGLGLLALLGADPGSC